VSSTALQNPAGKSTEVFTSYLVPIDPRYAYQVEMSAKQYDSSNGVAYLAIAWYSENGHLLASNLPQPEGAGMPRGWNNGTCSYFGLVAAEAPSTWTTYRISFGRNEDAAIPSNAKFVRVGALLNYNSSPGATIQLTNIRLWRKSTLEFVADGTFPDDTPRLVIIPPSRMLYSYASQAEQASHHWPAQRMESDFAGNIEIAIAASAAEKSSVEYGSFIILKGRLHNVLTLKP
jgi:hypothetical protein